MIKNTEEDIKNKLCNKIKNNQFPNVKALLMIFPQPTKKNTRISHIFWEVLKPCAKLKTKKQKTTTYQQHRDGYYDKVLKVWEKCQNVTIKSYWGVKGNRQAPAYYLRSRQCNFTRASTSWELCDTQAAVSCLFI